MSAEQQTETLVFAGGPRFVDEPYPPGVVGVLTREVGTFKDFLISYRRLLIPTGSGESFLSGGEKVASRNAAAEVLLANPACDWLWFMDDDHKFPPSILLRQLATFYRDDFDVLGMLYLTRLAPTSTYPVGGIFARGRDGTVRVRDLTWADLPRHGDIFARADLTMGTAGLLIRRRVFDKLAAPFFQVGQIRRDKEHEDLYFVIRCQELGLKVGMDVSQCLGHTARCTLWVERDAEGDWHVQVDMDARLGAREAGRAHVVAGRS